MNDRKRSCESRHRREREHRDWRYLVVSTILIVGRAQNGIRVLLELTFHLENIEHRDGAVVLDGLGQLVGHVSDLVATQPKDDRRASPRGRGEGEGEKETWTRGFRGHRDENHPWRRGRLREQRASCELTDRRRRVRRGASRQTVLAKCSSGPLPGGSSAGVVQPALDWLSLGPSAAIPATSRHAGASRRRTRSAAI